MNECESTSVGIFLEHTMSLIIESVKAKTVWKMISIWRFDFTTIWKIKNSDSQHSGEYNACLLNHISPNPYLEGGGQLSNFIVTQSVEIFPLDLWL